MAKEECYVFEQDLIRFYEQFVEARGETRELMALLVQKPDQAQGKFHLIYTVRDALRRYLAQTPAGQQFIYYCDGLMEETNTRLQALSIVHDLRSEYFGQNEYRYPEADVVQNYLEPLAECTQEFGVLFRAVLSLRDKS